MNKYPKCLVLNLVLWLGAASLAFAAILPDNLRCEYRSDPLGIDAPKPRLSWILSSEVRGDRQTAYRVLVASSPEKLEAGEGDLWDSGKVISDQSSQVEYAGKAMSSRIRCYWKVQVWDKEGRLSEWSAPALWTMGLLNESEWKAQWIGLEENLPKVPKADTLVLNRAMYQGTKGEGARDVTAIMLNKGEKRGGVIRLDVKNEALGGDPAPDKSKELRVEYEFAGKRKELVLAEGKRLQIPTEEEMRQPLATPRALRKPFAVVAPIVRATIYVTALGLYEIRLNGHRVGDHLLAPEWTSYSKRVQYQTYDVTGLVTKGENTLAALLGNGWYCGLWQHWPPQAHLYGEEPFLMAQLEIETADGNVQRIVSDTSWRGTLDGPLRFSGIYEGETYDATREMPGWDAAGFDDSKWQSVKLGQEFNVGQRVWQRSQPIRCTQELPAVKLTEAKPGVYVFDLGQNIAGWCRLKVTEPAGTTVTLKHNEVLNPDGTVYMDNLHAGNLSTGDRQIVRYTCKGGGEELFEPHFTYQGFRYVEVTGLSKRPELGAIVGRVFNSDCPETGSFACSHPLLNKLAQNIVWSQRANFMGVPTDCPQRDERCGYTGDAQFFMPTALYNMDVAAFFNKCLVDLCQDSAHPKTGAFSDHMPDIHAGGYANVGWGDAGIICPYLFYQAYGDTLLLREHYEAMRRHMEYWVRNAQGYVRKASGPRDWLNKGGSAKSEVIATAYYAYLAGLMGEIAHAIGQEADAVRYRALAMGIRTAFAKEFIAEDGSIQESSQTGFALAFTMGIVPPALKEKMAAKFVGEIERFDWHLATGFIGTPRLLPGLHAAGRDDVAWRLLLQETCPSWLYPVTVGATTCWERWDGWTKEKGFQASSMNSFNHYAFGAVGEYLFGEIGGISAGSPGYRTIRIKPVIRPELTWAKTSYQSIRGKIATDWNTDAGKLTLKVTIPANTTATVYVPAKDAAGVTEGGKPVAQTVGVRFLGNENGTAVFAVESGDYVFSSMLP